MRFQQSPGLRVGRGPILSEDAGSNGSLVLQFSEAFLDCDPDVAARAARTVSVNKLHKRAPLLPGKRKFTIELHNRFTNQGHTRFKIDRTESQRLARYAHEDPSVTVPTYITASSYL